MEFFKGKLRPNYVPFSVGSTQLNLRFKGCTQAQEIYSWVRFYAQADNMLESCVGTALERGIEKVSEVKDSESYEIRALGITLRNRHSTLHFQNTIGAHTLALPKIQGIGFTAYYALRESVYVLTDIKLTDPTAFSEIAGSEGGVSNRSVTNRFLNMAKEASIVIPSKLYTPLLEEYGLHLKPESAEYPKIVAVRMVLTVSAGAAKDAGFDSPDLAALRFMRNPRAWLYLKPAILVFDISSAGGYFDDAHKVAAGNFELIETIQNFNLQRAALIAQNRNLLTMTQVTVLSALRSLGFDTPDPAYLLNANMKGSRADKPLDSYPLYDLAALSDLPVKIKGNVTDYPTQGIVLYPLNLAARVMACGFQPSPFNPNLGVPKSLLV